MTQVFQRTVLFADLRGSTSMYETLGNAEATTVVAIKVLVEPVEIGIGFGVECAGGSPQKRPLSFLITQPELDQTV